jgi:glycosyltransferase involved in cell wall biosynthesis
MAGLGIRTFELARVVTAHADVTVAHGGDTEGDFEGVPTLPFRPHDPIALRAPLATADVVVTHPVWPLLARWLRRSGARIVHDLYDPEALETLELFAGSRLRPLHLALALDRLHDALRTGHHFMCASETQRDLWLGALLAARAIAPARYDADPTLRSLVDLVPFGVPAERPRPAPGTGPRGRLVPPDAELVLWNGGIWRWLDAEGAIRAVARLAPQRPRLRLVFMGRSSHPAARAAAERARAVAANLGMLGDRVIFHEEWVAYAERAEWLADADCAISAHVDHLESRFAFRTRILDCFWAGLPVACTAGDDLADQVERDGLGAVAPSGDTAALADALGVVLDRGRAAYADALARAAADATWPLAAEPLIRWVTDAGPPAPRLQPARPTAAARARTGAYLFGGRRLLAR